MAKFFSDIDLGFTPHPVTGDLLVKTDENAVKNSIRNLVLTRHWERPFRSAIGSNVNSLLFELDGPALGALIQKEIENVIVNFETRVDLISVVADVNSDRNAVKIRITFKIKNTEKPVLLDLILKRTR